MTIVVFQDESTTSMEDVKTFFVAPEVIPQLLPIEARKILSNEEYVGPYNFDVCVVPNYKSKNPWVVCIHFHDLYTSCIKILQMM